MPDPTHSLGPVDDLYQHGDRLRKLEAERKPKGGGGSTTFQGLKDVQFSYKADANPPLHGALALFDKGIPSKPYGGKWRPVGGPFWVSDLSDLTGTGDLTWDQDIPLPEGLPDDVPVMVVATMWCDDADITAQVTYTDSFLVSIEAGTVWSLIIDGAPAVDVEFATDTDIPVDPLALDIVRPKPRIEVKLFPAGGPVPDHMDFGYGTSNVTPSGGSMAATATWTFSPGAVPHISATLTLDSDDYPASHTVKRMLRVWPLPALVEPTP